MRPDPAFDGTLVLDICSESKKIREAIWLQDTVLIGPLTVDGIDVRFYNFPYRIEIFFTEIQIARSYINS